MIDKNAAIGAPRLLDPSLLSVESKSTPLADFSMGHIVAAWSGEPINIPPSAWSAILLARAKSQQPLELDEVLRIIESQGGHYDHC